MIVRPPRWTPGYRPNPVFTPPYRALVDELVAARRRAGLSQRQLALRLGRASSHVQRIESGQRRVDLLEFCNICRALGECPETLIGRISRAVAAAGALPAA